MLLSINNLSKYHNEKCILNNAKIVIEDMDKIGLIGLNGVGKSTLLKIIAQEENYEGDSMIKKNGLKISYLRQNPIFNYENTIIEEVQRQMNHNVELFEIKAMLNRLGIDYYDKSMSILSGGQCKRVALAITLLQESDLLLLDEPTNHLDNEMIEYLENYLSKYRGAILMVTHDRYFLERVVNHIYEIDRGNIYEYEANYSQYLTLKAEREQVLLNQEKKRNAFLKKELEWVVAGVQARGTKSRDRLQRFEELSKIEKVKTNKNVEMIHTSSRLGSKTISLHHLSKAYDGKYLFKDFEYYLKRFDRIGVLGKNGCGKSTLLDVIANITPPTSGEVIYGETVRIAYYKQGIGDMDEDKKVIDYIRDVSDDLETNDGKMSATMMCERFLFDANTQYSYISRLSGGEKRRLYLLKILMQAPNILLLDEPTNDLDIETLTILEDYLDDFKGAVIVVSHDRYFLDRVCDSLFVFEDSIIHKYNGGYSNYYKEEKVKEEKDDNRFMEYKKQKDIQKLTQPYMSSKDKNELQKLPELIEELEKDIKKIDSKMNQSENYEEINQLSIQRNEIEDKLENYNLRFLELLELEEQVIQFKNNR